jgi:hypothetical protein
MGTMCCFNVHGPGADVTLSGNAYPEGVLMANKRKVNLSSMALVKREVIANKITLSGSAKVTHPPVTSP